MNPQEMTDEQLYAQYDRARDGIAEWTKIIREAAPGKARDEFEKNRDKLHALACDLKWEMGQRI